jgi:acyl-CoA thioesterase FadM
MLALRMMGVAFSAPFRPRLGLLGESRLNFRVLPADLDYNIHMNNARYLALMDVGRVDLILRSGMWRAMWRNHWQAVLAGSIVRYRRPLKPFQKMQMVSRLIGWDEKWFYIDHRIASGDVVSCQAMVRGAFLSGDGIISPLHLASALGEAAVSPQLPGWISAWGDADRAFGQRAFATSEEA